MRKSYGKSQAPITAEGDEGRYSGAKPASALKTHSTALTGNVSSTAACNTKSQICGTDTMTGFQDPYQEPYFGHSGFRNVMTQNRNIVPYGVASSTISTAWTQRVFPAYDRAYRMLVRIADTLTRTDVEVVLQRGIQGLALWWELEQYFILAEGGYRNKAYETRAGILGSSDLKNSKDTLARFLSNTFMPPGLRRYVFWLYKHRTLRNIPGSTVVHFYFNNSASTPYDAPSDYIAAVNAIIGQLANAGVSTANIKLMKVMDSVALTEVPPVETPQMEEEWSDVWFNTAVRTSGSPALIRPFTASTTAPVQFLTTSPCPTAVNALSFEVYNTAVSRWEPGLTDVNIDLRPSSIDDVTGYHRFAANLQERSTEAAAVGTHLNVDDAASPGLSYGSVLGAVPRWVTLYNHMAHVRLLYEHMMGINQLETVTTRRSIVPTT